jgi:hypothetical protein
MKHRCENTSNKSYKNYGGRGIQFLFESTSDAAIWIEDNLGACRELEIDRIDNDGHYEPGNLRWSTHSENNNNKRNTTGVVERARVFLGSNPSISYSLKTIRRLFSRGFSEDQIASRWRERLSRGWANDARLFAVENPNVSYSFDYVRVLLSKGFTHADITERWNNRGGSDGRWSNNGGSDGSWVGKARTFLRTNPSVGYTAKTIGSLFSQGATDSQVIAKWNNRGVQGSGVTKEARLFLSAHPGVSYSLSHVKFLLTKGLTWDEINTRQVVAKRTGGSGKARALLADNPGVNYTFGTVKVYLSTGLTPDQIIARWEKRHGRK